MHKEIEFQSKKIESQSKRTQENSSRVFISIIIITEIDIFYYLKEETPNARDF